MHPYTGNNLEYRGYLIKNNKKKGDLEVFDKDGNYLFRKNNFSHGSLTEVKNKIDWLIATYK